MLSSNENGQLLSLVDKGDARGLKDALREISAAALKAFLAGTSEQQRNIGFFRSLIQFLFRTPTESPSLLDTPLHRAIKKDHPAVVETLINLGAKVEAKDKSGWIPIISLRRKAVGDGGDPF
ncbi:uncharacterized protein LOC119575973 [Penaeus monodon]|uniref:uncharacterized protein LOC119575973 n=1 Tax=Penaeus monodon TaxID=6687 RepID=UPI0018A6FF3B|nr:uncharacterized protein LOC119575973 [Penaeus monodon]